MIYVSSFLLVESRWEVAPYHCYHNSDSSRSYGPWTCVSFRTPISTCSQPGYAVSEMQCYMCYSNAPKTWWRTALGISLMVRCDTREPGMWLAVLIHESMR
jgi:hypothetical protein